MADNDSFGFDLCKGPDSGEDVISLPVYLNRLRTGNFLPMSAPYVFRNAVGSALEKRSRGREGPLAGDVSPEVLRMLRDFAAALGWDESLSGGDNQEAPVSDGRSRVVIAWVNSPEEGAELTGLMRACAQSYAEYARGRVFSVRGCRYRDEPLRLLSDESAGRLTSECGRGGPVWGEPCSVCRLIYGGDPLRVRVRAAAKFHPPRFGIVGSGDFGLDEAMVTANRGMLEVCGPVRGDSLRALRMVVRDGPVRIGVDRMTPSVLAVCALDWSEPVPEDILANAVVLRSTRPSGESELSHAVARGISGAAKAEVCHVAPHVPVIAARAVEYFGDGSGPAEVVRDMRDVMASLDGCMGHRRAFDMLFDEEDSEEAALSMSSDLQEMLSKDVLMAMGCSGDLRFEQTASLELMENYLIPLGFVKLAEGEKGRDAGVNAESVARFEAGVRDTGLLKTGSEEEMASLRDAVFSAYRMECEALVYLGKEAYLRRSASGEIIGYDVSLPVDMNTFGYAREFRIGQYMEMKLLPSLEDLRERAGGEGAKGLRRRVVGALCRYYGYCVRCADEAHDIVVAGMPFRSPPAGFLGLDWPLWGDR